MNHLDLHQHKGHFLALLVIFLLSGCSGLIYEVVWLRMLIRVFGVTVYAVSTILFVFMGGLALGSFISARLFGKSKRILLVYAIIEIAVGIAALLSTVVIAKGEGIFVALSQSLGGGEIVVVVVRFLFSLVVLLLPTFLMGATLPLLSNLFATNKEKLGKSIGFLYGMNTLGAVIGVTTCGFFLIYLLGELGCVFFSALLNFAVGIIAWILHLRVKITVNEESPQNNISPGSEENTLISRLIFVYALSGFCALAYQVLWSRMLILVLGNSVYGFSSMLAMYLAGIALGSMAMARYCDRLQKPLVVFAYLEMGIALLSLLSIITFTTIGSSKLDPLYLYSTIWSIKDFFALPLKSFLIVFPTTLLMGMLFPILSKICTMHHSSVALAVGKVYGWNTVGAIFGSFFTGFVFIPVLGTRASFIFIAALSLFLGIYVLWLYGAKEVQKSFKKPIVIAMLSFLLLQIFLLKDPFLAIFKVRLPKGLEILAHEENKAATVTIARSKKSDERLVYINGMLVSGTGILGRLMVNRPLLFHPNPKKSLLVGFGSGGAFRGSINHGVHTTVVDLVEEVVASFPLMGPRPNYYLQNPKAKIAINDGRNYLLQSQEKYDFVLVDGSPPIFSSGVVNLYTLEFVQLVKKRLSKDGIFTIWVPSPCFKSDFWMIAKNFAQTFRHISVMWESKYPYGAYLMGTSSPKDLFKISRKELLRRRQIRIPHFSEVYLMAFDKLTEEQVRQYAAKYPTVTDNYPYTEFPLLRFWRQEKFYRKLTFLEEIAKEKK